jgi:hypothetical protein
MFYNTRNQTISSLPLTGYFEDGTLVQGLNLAEPETIALCGYLPVKSDTPQPDDTYEDETQRTVVIEEDGVIVTRVWLPNPVSVPSTISPRQIRLWLVNHGIVLSAVEAAIDGIEDESLKETTRIEWEYSPYVERTHPMIDTLGAALGLTGEQIDTAFIDASIL